MSILNRLSSLLGSSARQQPQAQALPPIHRGDHVCIGEWKGMPIEWRVLDADGPLLLLVTEHAICTRVFNPYDAYSLLRTDLPPAWEESELKRWLESTFFHEAGLPAVPFLLSVKEAETYFDTPEDRRCHEIIYVPDTQVSEKTWKWWLRSSAGKYPGMSATVDDSGVIDTEGWYNTLTAGVRPAMKVIPEIVAKHL